MENGVLLQGFHWYIKPEEKLWKQLQEKVKSYKEMGFSAIWLPPAYKGVGGINDNGYGVYDLYDLGEFNQKGSIETKYGTKEEYIKEFINIIKNDCKSIKLVRMEASKSKIYPNTTFYVDKKNGEIECYPIERKLLYTIWKISKKESLIKEKYYIIRNVEKKS